MAIIDCPSCAKKVSDKAKTCQYCNLDLQDLDPEKLAHIRKINQIKKSQQLMTWSFIAMILFCGGFFTLYWFNTTPDSISYMLSVASIVIGVVLYVVTRIRILLFKRNK